MSDVAIPCINVLGVGVHAVNISRVTSLVESALARGGKYYVCFTGVHGVMEAQRDGGLKTVLNSSFLNVPDGRPTVWVGWIQGFAEMDQVGGPELMLEVCRLSVQKAYTHFLFGGNPGVAETLRAILQRRFPGIKIVGTYTPPFRPLDPQEEADLLRIVGQTAPDIFWVGISTPKQEKFMAEYLAKLNTKMMFGVGAAFDFHTGRAKSAPQWMKRAGLAWFHRFCQDPGRLWQRYLFNIPKFLCAITLQLLGWRTCTLERHTSAET